MQGQFPRECILCGFSGRFLPAGRPPRYDAKCPRCMSVERHRLLALKHQQHDLVPAGATVLHFAPEPALRSLLQTLSGSYTSADIQPGRADMTLDVERLDLADDSYDVIVASHILEHVDDSLALTELRRVLRPGGRAILFTPVIEGWATTYENTAVTDQRERLLHFGQEDHVRFYGQDLRERITRSGFELTELQGTPDECARYGLTRGEVAFVCVSP